MNNTKIYSDIATRTNGDVYIGVVGPVRVGKSTFIKKFMETLIIPEIENQDERARAIDEIPQSAAGKTVMTTEPKFIPEKAVKISLQGNVALNVKLVDCVGYMVDGANGVTENGEERMVMTPWSSSPVPFEVAAETGTKKVIKEHSTIGIMVTTDGSFGELERSSYEESERRVVNDLKASGKPFIIVLNSSTPDSDKSIETALELERKYNVPVALINCLEMGSDDIEHILELCLFEFPVTEVTFISPKWISALHTNHPIRKELESLLKNTAEEINSVASIHNCIQALSENENISNVKIQSSELGNGRTAIKVDVNEKLFYSAISNELQSEIRDDKELYLVLSELGKINEKYRKIEEALRGVEETGYGIVVPQVDDLILEEPEIIKQSGGYGVKLKACADSIHMIKAKIKTEINPIVGSEKQSEEMVKFLLNEFEENPRGLWESNMFGKSLYCLVNEGLNAKLDHMPQDARDKIGQTLQKIVNEGSNGLICIIL